MDPIGGLVVDNLSEEAQDPLNRPCPLGRGIKASPPVQDSVRNDSTPLPR